MRILRAKGFARFGCVWLVALGHEVGGEFAKNFERHAIRVVVWEQDARAADALDAHPIAGELVRLREVDGLSFLIVEDLRCFRRCPASAVMPMAYVKYSAMCGRLRATDEGAGGAVASPVPLCRASGMFPPVAARAGEVKERGKAVVTSPR